MANTSRSQVTITLGRSGQVVKRAGAVLDSEFSDPVTAVGSKRSVRDRLGSSVDALHFDSKRQRGVNGTLSFKAISDNHLSKNDLRFKIMKQTQSNGQQKIVDLRDVLSRQTRSSSTNHGMDHIPPDRRNGRPRTPQHSPEPRDDRRRMPEPVNDQWRIPDKRRPMIEARDGRRLLREPIEPKLNDEKQHIPNPTNGSMPRRVTSTRTLEALSQMDLSRNSYSPWTLDQIRRRSPIRVLDNSRGISPPPPRTEEPQRRTIIRAYNDPRAGTYASRDVREIARPMTTASFPIKPSLSDGPTKPIGPLVNQQLPLVQRSQYPVKLSIFFHTVSSFSSSKWCVMYFWCRLHIIVCTCFSLYPIKCSLLEL